MTITEPIEEHRACQADSAKLMSLLRSLKAARSYGNAFAAACNRHCQFRWSRYSTSSELGARLHNASAEFVVLSLIDAGSEACANALRDLSEFASGARLSSLLPPRMT